MSVSTTDDRRRRVLRALVAAPVLAGLSSLLPSYARPNNAALGRASAPGDVAFDLHIRRERIAIAGGHAQAITLNGTTPGPLIELYEGHNAHLRVHNHLDEPSSIHWHGILLPFQMDGVPGVAFPGIAPGETFEAAFPVRQAGTYWYHSHSGFQEQKGLTGPLVIHPAGGQREPADRDYVLVLNDWTFEDPARIFDKLKKMPDYYNFRQRTLGDFVKDVGEAGVSATVRDRLAWNTMRMSPRDIADVTALTYHHLINGLDAAGNWTGLFTPGQRIRLRVINASSMTYYNVRLPGLAMTVVAADGKDVEPVEIDEFQLGVAETFDVIVTPTRDRAYTIMAESMDRSGYVRATLAPRPGMQAKVPPLRGQPQRTMIDMGMAMSGMAKDHGASHGQGDIHSMQGMAGRSGTGTMMEPAGPIIAHHEKADYGVGNISQAAVQRYRLGDRGTGLKDVAHRVLTYGQLRNVITPPDRHAPVDRTIELHLTGNMDRYMWSFDGDEFSQSTPIDFPLGKRIRLVLVNDTMMEHPIHLHGMFMQLENRQGDRLPYKHTISVLPASRVSLLVTADEPGRWAFHCHLLYHMEAGMFRVVRVAPQEALDHA